MHVNELKFFYGLRGFDVLVIVFSSNLSKDFLRRSMWYKQIDASKLFQYSGFKKKKKSVKKNWSLSRKVLGLKVFLFFYNYIVFLFLYFYLFCFVVFFKPLCTLCDFDDKYFTKIPVMYCRFIVHIIVCKSKIEYVHILLK